MGRYSNQPRKLEIFFTILKLWKLWNKYPYLRLAQLLHLSTDEFHTEDNNYIRKIEKKYKE